MNDTGKETILATLVERSIAFFDPKKAGYRNWKSFNELCHSYRECVEVYGQKDLELKLRKQGLSRYLVELKTFFSGTSSLHSKLGKLTVKRHLPMRDVNLLLKKILCINAVGGNNRSNKEGFVVISNIFHVIDIYNSRNCINLEKFLDTLSYKDGEGIPSDAISDIKPYLKAAVFNDRLYQMLYDMRDRRRFIKGGRRYGGLSAEAMSRIKRCLTFNTLVEDDPVVKGGKANRSSAVKRLVDSYESDCQLMNCPMCSHIGVDYRDSLYENHHVLSVAEYSEEYCGFSVDQPGLVIKLCKPAHSWIQSRDNYWCYDESTDKTYISRPEPGFDSVVKLFDLKFDSNKHRDDFIGACKKYGRKDQTQYIIQDFDYKITEEAI